MPPKYPMPAFPPPDKRLAPVGFRVLAPASVSPKALTPLGEYVGSLAQQANQSRLMAWLTELVAYPTRHTLSSHNVDAAHWLRRQFKALGYSDVVLEPFQIQGTTRYNVVCTKVGATQPAKVLVLGAHYDSRSAISDPAQPAPGAVDNGTGTVALLEVARALRDVDTAWTIRFVAFSGEEQGLTGSLDFAGDASSAGMNIALMINLDMIGHPANASNPTIIVERDVGNVHSSNDAASQSFANAMVQAAADYTSLSTSLDLIWGSDYMPFEAQGYVCIGAYDDAASTSFYHSTTDTIDKVDGSFFTDVVRMVIATIAGAAAKKEGAALIFDPDPITTSGNTSLTTTSLGLDSLRRPASLQGLDAPDGSGNYHLSGSHVKLTDAVAPTIAPVTTSDGVFVYSRGTDGFEEVMAYHHVDRTGRHLGALGFTSIVPAPIMVDAHGPSSSFDPIAKRIVLAHGGSGAAPDGEDGGAIVHLFGRAILATQNPGFSSTNGLGTGFCDALSVIVHDDRHASWSATRAMVAPWAGWGRRADRSWTYSTPGLVGDSALGELWASSVFELYRLLGGDSMSLARRRAGRDLMLKLHLEANSKVPVSGATPAQMAQQIEAADASLGGWRGLADKLHTKVIYDVFERRKVPGYSAKTVDLYVDDGRDGGYSWQDHFWKTKDVWVRPVPYSAAGLASASPSDHQEPTAGSPAYLYVRVKNKGSATSGPLTVKAFHCEPGMGLTWPSSWKPMDTPSLSIATVAPGSANAVVVGPFKWTPSQVGHECVLVVVECAADPAITEILAPGATVGHSDLVPFDNNIAQRNLSPVPARTSSKRGFYVGNPYPEPREVDFEVRTELPAGWVVRTEPSLRHSLRLEPFERRWVDLDIDREFGANDADPNRRVEVEVVGQIDGLPIGGITFYAAPDAAFGSSAPSGSSLTGLGSCCCLGLDPSELEVEGRIRVRIRFRKR